MASSPVTGTGSGSAASRSSSKSSRRYTQVLSVLLFDKSDEGNFEMLASIGLILVFITVVLILAGFRLMGRDFMLRRTAA